MSEYHLSIPKTGSGPAVLVLHSFWGLTPFFRRLCGRLARNGYVALAPDLFDEQVADTVAEAEALRAASTAGRKEPVYRFLIRHIELLLEHEAVEGSSLGILGFSMGGHWAFWLSQRAELPIAATVTFYAARGGDYSRTHSSFLCHFAEQDDWVSDAARKRLVDRLHKHGAQATVHSYPGTGHWFFERNRRDAFVPGAARLAWTRTLDFLDSNLPAQAERIGRRRSP